MRNQVIQDFQKIGLAPSVIFDVGANVGQSLVEFGKAYPEARIHSFEPIEATFQELKQCAALRRNATAHCLALSSTRQEVVMRAVGASTGNRIMAADVVGSRAQAMSTVTGDEVATSLGVDRIDYLKIDTEGHDLDVVKGFSAMIRAKRIEFIQVECGFAPENDRHVTFHQFTEHFFPLGYRLFGIYGQRRQFGNDKTRQLMFGDAVFVAMP